MNKELNVLVLDDEINILNSLGRAFRDEPFGLFTTTHPEEALEILRRENIKVVMSDQKMPKMEGVEFLRRVKEIKRDVIRVLFTGYADIQIAEDAINQGEVYRFINKPWNDEDLKAILRDTIKAFDLTAENKRLSELTQRQNKELELANQQLKYLAEKQKEFTTTVSHELRTPLASMKMAIDVIVSRNTMKRLDVTETAYLNIAKSAIDRLRRLVDDVLDLSKLEAGKKILKMEKYDVHEIIKEVIAIQTPLAEKKGLNLKMKLAETPLRIPVNPDKIHQLLNNLVTNAIKYTDKGDITISSSVAVEENCLRICVKDTGKGIAREDFPRLFQKFEQLGERSEQVNGTGLGLAICKEIVSLHQGNIWVESEPGKGSSFIFTLPAGDEKGA